MDSWSRLGEAESLVSAGLANLEVKLSPLDFRPMVIFCTTQECFEGFGFDRASAQTLGTSATVIGPKGWAPHHLKHELIHQWQAAEVGSLKMLMLPEWFREGMAYALSDDPRNTLSEPWQSYRERFERLPSISSHERIVVELRKHATLF